MITATINHELKNPLNVLVLFLMELINSSDKIGEAENKIISACYCSAKFLENLIG